jgi:hypothetical protein
MPFDTAMLSWIGRELTDKARLPDRLRRRGSGTKPNHRTEFPTDPLLVCP